jgi:hypothetical protein
LDGEKLPSSVFLGIALVAILGFVAFKAAKKHPEALFIGQWVAPFLFLAVYNKMVKHHGSDVQSRNNSLAA